MRILSRVVLAGAAFAATAYADPLNLPSGCGGPAAGTGSIAWKPCGQDSKKLCGKFVVPLDYQSDVGNIALSVACSPAESKPRIGTLFLNPGGPGESGVEFITDEALSKISEITGGRYDLVSWDPRGVDDTEPRVTCFDVMEGIELRENTTIEARTDSNEPEDLAALNKKVTDVDKLLVDFGIKCQNRSSYKLQYVGTAASVRDMVALHDYLEGSSQNINFWGLSYGTVLGVYFVNMFPGRVGRVVLDGVVDPVYWANTPPHKMWAVALDSAEKTLDGFLSACASAGPTRCAFAYEGSTAESLRNDIRELINIAYKDKGSADIRMQLLGEMYHPTDWPQLARELDKIRRRQANAPQTIPTGDSLGLQNALKLHRQPVSSNLAPPAKYVYQAVTCGDAIDSVGVTTQMVFDELVEVTRDVSHMFGPIWGAAGFYCHHWPVRAVERYAGPWNMTLGNKILIIGNMADPITPLKSAKRVADALGESAVLVEQRGYGHLSSAMRSNCTESILESYFEHGILPSENQHCETDQVLFPGRKASFSINVSSVIASAFHASYPFDLHDKLGGTHVRGRRLFVATIALGSATGLLLVFRIFSRCRMRETHTASIAEYPTMEKVNDAHEKQDSMCSNTCSVQNGQGKGAHSPV